MRVVTHEAALHRRTDDGALVRDHLTLAAERGSAMAAAKLRAPEYPDALGYLHEWWQELSWGRPEGMSGPGRLTWDTLDAWARARGHALAPHEALALLQLDAAYLTTLAEGKQEKPATATRGH